MLLATLSKLCGGELAVLELELCDKQASPEILVKYVYTNVYVPFTNMLGFRHGDAQ